MLDKIAKMNFWKETKKPISCLAPMYDVTDSVFRDIISEIGKPDVLYTEFVNTDAFTSDGKHSVEKKLLFSEKQSPVVAQIWGINPESYYKTAKELVKMGFDGIDINMGCPQKPEMKIGACAALINNHNLAAEIINATKQGAGNIPVSVKTRIGVKKIKTEEWTEFLLNQGIAALIIHARTATQMSKVPADWNEIAKAVKVRNSMRLDTPIIGNGDIIDFQHGQRMCEEYNCDGYMIGRGMFENPWAFVEVKEEIDNKKGKLLKLAIRHLEHHKEVYKGNRNYNILKKFFKIYARDFEDASNLRAKLMETKSEDAAIELIQNYLNLQ